MIGSTIGHYKIEEKLGEGGMGVVYKAVDTKLDRLVALKFLPESSAPGSDASRFLQEAKAAAALNHPNICTIHGIEEAEGRAFIVMEFVDGQTLQEKKSSLSLKQAVDIGIQIAEGLAAAHEKGIVHRDVKPENIMVRKDGIVQIMDFGLAKLRGVTRLTKEGSTVGTAGYMSPEQVQGHETDHRSDIFSLGVLLFEMMTGQLPFKGMHETAVSYEIVNVDSPPMSSIKQAIPPELDAVVLDCLEKDPKERTQAASQVALELKRFRRESSRQRASRITAARPISSSSAVTSLEAYPIEEAGVREGPRKTRIPFLLIGSIIFALLLGFAAAYFLFPSSGGGLTIQGSLESPDGVRFNGDQGGHSVISPDGKIFAFVGRDSVSSTALYVRTLGSKSSTKLAGTERAEYPFWSPDNRSVAFFAGGKLKRVDVAGSPPLTVADAASGRGGAWSPEGSIVFAPDVSQKDLFIVPASGGTARAITNFDSTSGMVPRFPFFLPDGKHFLFVTMKLSGGSGIQRDDYVSYVGDLDGKMATFPLKGASNMMFASGKLLYLRQGTLIAQPFSPGSYELTGDPVPIDNNVNFWPERAKGDFSVSQTGVLVYGANVREAESQICWMDLEGRSTPILNGRVEYVAGLSPDGNVIAYDEFQREDRNLDIWLYDIGRKVKTRFTFNSGQDFVPVWRNDGKLIFFASQRPGNKHFEVFAKQPEGLKEEESVVASVNWDVYPTACSPDNRYLLVSIGAGGNGWDLGYADIKGDRKVVPILSTKFNEGFATFSPDGKWIAYTSNESGKDEIYVRPFLRDGAKWQVSSGGGSGPVWRASGEIFFDTPTSQQEVRADISGATPRFSLPRELFRSGNETGISVHDVTRDGKKFLITKSANVQRRNALSLIVNWQALVQSR